MLLMTSGVASPTTWAAGATWPEGPLAFSAGCSNYVDIVEHVDARR